MKKLLEDDPDYPELFYLLLSLLIFLVLMVFLITTSGCYTEVVMRVPPQRSSGYVVSTYYVDPWSNMDPWDFSWWWPRRHIYGYYGYGYQNYYGGYVDPPTSSGSRSFGAQRQFRQQPRQQPRQQQSPRPRTSGRTR